MREHASLGARRERDVTEPSHSFQKRVLETDCAVKLLTEEAETSLILSRTTATKVTPRGVAHNKSVAAHIVPPERLPCALAGPGATTRVMRSTPTEDPRERVKERVQNRSTLRKAREWARDVGQNGLVPSGETVMANSNHSGPVVHTEQGRMG